MRDGLEKWFTTSDVIRPDLHSYQRACDRIVESGDASAVSHRKTGPAREPWICEEETLGQGRELTVFWGTDGARGRRLAWERDVRGLDPDGCLVRRSHGRHHTQENRDASAATNWE